MIPTMRLGPTFLSIQHFASEPTTQKRRAAGAPPDRAKFTAKQMIAELERDPGATPHVQDPRAPMVVFGPAPSEVLAEAEARKAQAHDRIGRRVKGEASIITSIVVSHPVPRTVLEARPDGGAAEIAAWQELEIAFLQREFGDRLRCVVRHGDESHVHLHALLVPDLVPHVTPRGKEVLVIDLTSTDPMYRARVAFRATLPPRSQENVKGAGRAETALARQAGAALQQAHWAAVGAQLGWRKPTGATVRMPRAMVLAGARQAPGPDPVEQARIASDQLRVWEAAAALAQGPVPPPRRRAAGLDAEREAVARAAAALVGSTFRVAAAQADGTIVVEERALRPGERLRPDLLALRRMEDERGLAAGLGRLRQRIREAQDQRQAALLERDRAVEEQGRLASLVAEAHQQNALALEAQKRIMGWVRLHPHNIAARVQIVVDHFRENVAHLLGGQAKAMVVTASRKEAVRWMKAMEAYIKRRKWPIGLLVAFSGDVEDPETGPKPFNETNMNPSLKGRDIRTAFGTEEYSILLVANKFQTGFDQPLLCAMYVDRQLGGIQAVQTLSRLNRAHPGKDTTYVVDFANEPEDIQAAFRQYHDTAELADASNPDAVLDLRAKLDGTALYDANEVEAVARAVVRPGAVQAQLDAAIVPVSARLLARYKAARQARAAEAEGSKAWEAAKAEMDLLLQFRHDLGAYVRAYEFLGQMFDYGQTYFEKLGVFARMLLPLRNSTSCASRAPRLQRPRSSPTHAAFDMAALRGPVTSVRLPSVFTARSRAAVAVTGSSPPRGQLAFQERGMTCSIWTAPRATCGVFALCARRCSSRAERISVSRSGRMVP